MRPVSLLFKEHVVAHYCAAVNRVPQRANAIAPWTQPTEMWRILIWDRDTHAVTGKKFCYPTTQLMHSRMFRSWPTMLCGIIPQHARTWSRTQHTWSHARRPFFLWHDSSGGGGVKHKLNMEGSSATALMHGLASIRTIYNGSPTVRTKYTTDRDFKRMLQFWASSSRLLPSLNRWTFSFKTWPKNAWEPMLMDVMYRPLLSPPNTDCVMWWKRCVSSIFSPQNQVARLTTNPFVYDGLIFTLKKYNFTRIPRSHTS